ncbi:hypothetical protein H4219_003893 [Mycoemilia scoparia]|uniref:Reverse transcriptase domain-containing protein n=1 Tax=Mycoemilia scoparia TaxID=417184 RepID=A0A9W8DSP8_9FUNG|nr:hypothetical protein H4219_003893 [Mycoemilia scoparia]
MNELMTGKGALCEYTSGCPPPAAYAPIIPPLKSDARPLYVAQHTMSTAAEAARVEFVKDHIDFGIDEPGHAHACVPIFGIDCPGTDKKRVLFDDSTNNSINMETIGIRLPTSVDWVKFLQGAKLLTSVDLASFFTAIRLHQDYRDFWTFLGRKVGPLRTTRLVQGNSESPAIAQAFIGATLV